jgi:hypothetical protein
MFPGLQSMPQVKCDVERVSHGSIEKFHEPKHDDGLIDATLTAINICFNAWISPAFVIASTISIVSVAIIRTSKITRKDPNLGILDTQTSMLHAIATMLRFLLLEKSLRQSRRERERESFPNPCEEKEEASPLVKLLSHKTSKTPPATLLIKSNSRLPTQQQQS